jgi:hypothetical protein
MAGPFVVTLEVSFFNGKGNSNATRELTFFFSLRVRRRKVFVPSIHGHKKDS